ncbi:hypothetical protein PQC65_gp204 [Aeromonas phage pAEv1810]|uniref:hypothetical protein n=1 Tax=Aeromonas phage pAEv1810 TaxID=2908744 RepID=UPI002329984A|nr:hypothetical protein PQC65_gp204 [Aeromonas phage pAEv1810]UIS25142.1 hypothetical protein pAEv1810_204 [Aeromonas phage pAEv1810]
MMNELKAQIFKKKVLGLKHKLRFLKDDEKIQEGDLHFKVSGDGVFKFKTQDSMMGYLEHRTKEAEIDNWEGKVLKYLSENLDKYQEGYKLILVARLLDNPDDTGLWSTHCFGEPVTDFPMRVFVRKI